MSASLQLTDPLARRLADLMAAGVAVPEGLEAAASEAESRRLRAALQRLADDMRRGAAVDADVSMERLTATLIAGSRTGGDFATALATLDEVDTRSSRLRRLLNVAWIYPATLLTLAAGCGFAVLGITSSAYADLFREYEIDGNEGLATYLSFYRVLLGGILAGAAGILVLVIVSRFYRAVWIDRLYWRLPLVGPAGRWLDLTIVCAVMSQLLAREVPYPEALRLARASIRSAALRAWLAQAAVDIEKGYAIDSAVMRLGRHAEVLPAFVEPRGVAAADPAGGWEIARRYFLRRATDRIRLVRAVLPVIGYLAIVAVVLSAIQAAIAPLGDVARMLTYLA